MMLIRYHPLVVGEPNWAPLEMVLSPRECEDFMYIGRAGDIQLYKHRWTRRYLNITSDGSHFYKHIDRGTYVEISRAEAISSCTRDDIRLKHLGAR